MTFFSWQCAFVSNFRKRGWQVIAERLSEEEIGGLKELFKMIDTDNSGSITFEELKAGLKKVGSELMESDIKSLMDAVDNLSKTLVETLNIMFEAVWFQFYIIWLNCKFNL